MSYCDIEKKSKRGAILRKTLELLLKYNPSVREINAYTNSTRGSSDVSELRQQGYDSVCIPCGKDAEGNEINRFELTTEAREKAKVFFERYEQ